MSSGIIICADARHIPLNDQSVNCCVTSPPYWGLRDYGTAKWEGGSSSCDHLQKCGQRQDTDRVKVDGFNGPVKAGLAEKPYNGTCGKCGATRVDKQLGLERTPEEYIAAMLEVFREVKRVLRDDGTLWLNLGDSYASDSKGSGGPSAKQLSNAGSRYEARHLEHGVKAKDLVGIPWMMAFALRADGWYLRSDIIWSKPNPMPESVTDRPTKAHEYIFLLSKCERYYYDTDAIAETAIYAGETRVTTAKSFAGQAAGLGVKPTGNAKLGSVVYIGEKRNKRSVWEVSSQRFPEAHFATFPEELIKPCILAGCPHGGTVLDPFVGSGTTVLVARDLQCCGIGLELNSAYIEIAKRRLSQEVFGFGI